jgi:outer membrane protein assembly factor BamE (lipoprotein component of BamABCDE complex)
MMNQKPHYHRLHPLLSLVALFMASCTPAIQTRGIDPDIIQADKIKKGVDTREKVLAALGSPSTVGSFGNENAWYYISKQQTNESIAKPQEIQSKVLIIVFNQNNVVQDVIYQKDLDTADINPDISKRTQTSGYESGVMREIFSNLGKMNTKKPTGPRMPD